ncbi:MAG: M14 family metallopeptidase [bacterium]
MKTRTRFLYIVGFIFAYSTSCTPPPTEPPDAGLYHTYEEVQTELQDLQTAFPQIAKVFNIGQSVEGRTIWAIKISDNVAQQEDETEILFLGGYHAREWIAVDVPFLLAKHLVESYSSDASIQNLVDNGQIWIVPMVNPDGHQYAVTNNRLWRKNRRNNGDGSFGVDLNRNHSYEWGGPGSSGNTFSETYRGTAPDSEPETRAVRDLANQHDFKAMISYHNYSQLVLYPWGHTNDPAPDDALMDQLATTMADKILQIHGERYVPEQSSDLYLASGDATDWLYGETRVPSFTIELRPDSAFPGFRLPESEIQPTFEENLPAALFLIQWTQDLSRMSTL